MRFPCGNSTWDYWERVKPKEVDWSVEGAKAQSSSWLKEEQLHAESEGLSLLFLHLSFLRFKFQFPSHFSSSGCFWGFQKWASRSRPHTNTFPAIYLQTTNTAQQQTEELKLQLSQSWNASRPTHLLFSEEPALVTVRHVDVVMGLEYMSVESSHESSEEFTTWSLWWKHNMFTDLLSDQMKSVFSKFTSFCSLAGEGSTIRV